MLGPESVLYIRMFLNLCPLYPRFTVGWLVNTEISPVWNCLNWIGVRTPKQVAAQKIYGRTLGWGSVGSRRSNRVANERLEDAVMLAITPYTPRYGKNAQKMELEDQCMALREMIEQIWNLSSV